MMGTRKAVVEKPFGRQWRAVAFPVLLIGAAAAVSVPCLHRLGIPLPAFTDPMAVVLAITGHEAPDQADLRIGTEATAELRVTCEGCVPLHGHLVRDPAGAGRRYVHASASLSNAAVDAGTAATPPGSPLFFLSDGTVLLVDVPADHRLVPDDCLPERTPAGAGRYVVSLPPTLDLVLRDQGGHAGRLPLAAMEGYETMVGGVTFRVTPNAIAVEWDGGTARVPRSPEGGQTSTGGGTTLDQGWTALPGMPSLVPGSAGDRLTEARVTHPDLGFPEFIGLEAMSGATRVAQLPAWPQTIRVPFEPGAPPRGRVGLFALGPRAAGVATPSRDTTIVVCTPRRLPWGSSWQVMSHGAADAEASGTLWIGAGRPYRLTRFDRPWGVGGSPVSAVRVEPVLDLGAAGAFVPPAARRVVEGAGWRIPIPACSPDDTGVPREYAALFPDSDIMPPGVTAFPVPDWARGPDRETGTPWLLVCHDRRGRVRGFQPLRDDFPAPARLLMVSDQGTIAPVGRQAHWFTLRPGRRYVLGGQVLTLVRPPPGWADHRFLAWLLIAALLAGFRLEMSLHVAALRAGTGDRVSAGDAGKRHRRFAVATRAGLGIVALQGILIGAYLAQQPASGWSASLAVPATMAVLFLVPVLAASRTGRWAETRWARVSDEVFFALLLVGGLLIADRTVVAWLDARAGLLDTHDSSVLALGAWVWPVAVLALAVLLRAGRSRLYFGLGARLARSAGASEPVSGRGGRNGWRARIAWVVAGGGLLVLIGEMVGLPIANRRTGQAHIALPIPPATGPLSLSAAPARDDCIQVAPKRRPDNVVRLCDGDVYAAGDHRLRLEVRHHLKRLLLVGGATDGGVVGSGPDAGLRLPLPGMAMRHLEILPPEDPACAGTVPCMRSLVASSRTRIQLEADAPALSVHRGEVVPLQDGMILWTGLVPLRVHVTPHRVILEAPRDAARIAGDRRWLGALVPGWNLVGRGPWTISGQTADRAPHGLEAVWDEAAARLAGRPRNTNAAGRLLEDAVQDLVDAGILCLKRTASRTPSSLVWRLGPGDCSARTATRAFTDAEIVAWRRVRRDDTAARWIARTNRILQAGRASRAVSRLPFVFDWRAALPAPVGARDVSGARNPGSDANAGRTIVREPACLLGVRRDLGTPPPMGWAARSHQGASPELPALTMQPGSTSPRLDLKTPIGPMNTGDTLLLTGLAPPFAPEIARQVLLLGKTDTSLLGAVCLSDGLPDGRLFWRPAAGRDAGLISDDFPPLFGGAVPAGMVSFSRDRSWGRLIGLDRTLSSAGQDCLLFARGAGGSFVDATSKAPAITRARDPRRSSLSWRNDLDIPALQAPGLGPVAAHAAGTPSGGLPGTRPGQRSPSQDAATPRGPDGAMTWTPISDGDTVTWEGLEATFHDTGDMAAEPDPLAPASVARRRYPFGADAGQLIGAGQATRSGLEAALTPRLRGLAGRVTLTIHGDLQRVVARALRRAMETKPTGHPRDGWTEPVRASALLLDADTGAVLADAVWPPVDSGTLARRTEGNRQAVPVASWENLALVRRAPAGDVYRLATLTAMARSGWFDHPRPLPGRWDPARPRVYRCRGAFQLYERRGANVLPHRRPDTVLDDWPLVTCRTSHAVWPDDPIWVSALAPRAFAQGCNIFFAVAASILASDGTGLGGAIPYFYLNTDRADLGLTDQIHGTFLTTPAWDPYGVVMAYFASDDRGDRFLPPDPATGRGANRLWETLLELGHRFRYRTTRGTVTQQQDRNWAPGHRYPTARRPWLPGLVPGRGFVYPEIPGPAALGGDSAWPEGPPPDTWLDGRLTDVERTGSFQTVLDVALGREALASPLSLALMAAPVASLDGRLVAPFLVASATPGRTGAGQGADTSARPLPEQEPWPDLARAPYVQMPEYLSSGRETLRVALRATGQDGQELEGIRGENVDLGRKFGPVRGAWLLRHIGLATGTTATGDTGAPSMTSRRPGEPWGNAGRGYACGVEGTPGTWPVPPGFAAQTSACAGLVPGMPPVAGTIAGTDRASWRDRARAWRDQALAWQDALTGGNAEGTPPDARSTVSAFVAAVLAPLTTPGKAWSDLDPSGGGRDGGAGAVSCGCTGEEAPSERALKTGCGLVLAVICDGHASAGEEAGMAILDDLARYYQVRGDAVPRPR